MAAATAAAATAATAAAWTRGGALQIENSSTASAAAALATISPAAGWYDTRLAACRPSCLPTMLSAARRSTLLSVLAAAGPRALRPASEARVRLIQACATPDPEPDSEYHVPVMLNEVVSWMLTDPSGTYADGTLGGGGHSAALLEVLAPGGGQLIGLDRDPDALQVAGARLQGYTQSGHAKLVKSNFANMPDALRGIGLTPRPGETGLLDGLLVDLGVSSHQINEGARGFSFMRDGPLDMRMDQSPDAKLTASEIINEWEVQDIARVLWEYGEEKDSRRLARALVAARPMHTTSELAAVLASQCKRGTPKAATKTAARVFQALRIAVNGELDELDAFLTAAAALVRPGGRLAVLSYHSLEDRRVKRLLRSGRLGGDSPPKDAYGNSLSAWTPLTRQPVTASDDEVALNPRARSAKLRVGERTKYDADIQAENRAANSALSSQAPPNERRRV